MAQACRTPHLMAQRALQWALGLEPSTVIVNAALTFAGPKNCSAPRKPDMSGFIWTEVRDCFDLHCSIFWSKCQQVPERFSLAGLGSVLFSRLSALRNLSLEAFLALSPQSVPVAMALPRPVVLLQSAHSISSFLVQCNLPWHISPSIFLEVNVILC